MGEKFNFLLLHLTLFNWTSPAVVEEICQMWLLQTKLEVLKPTIAYGASIAKGGEQMASSSFLITQFWPILSVTD